MGVMSLDNYEINPCPVCGRIPEVINYFSSPWKAQDAHPLRRLICRHTPNFYYYASYVTDPHQFIIECINEWNYMTGGFKKASDIEIPHNDFVNFLGGG